MTRVLLASCLLITLLAGATVKLIKANTLLKNQVASLELQVEQLQKLAKTAETLLETKCEKEIETERIITRTITKIKETPYEVPPTPESLLPEPLSRLLNEAYNDLQLREAP